MPPQVEEAEGKPFSLFKGKPRCECVREMQDAEACLKGNVAGFHIAMAVAAFHKCGEPSSASAGAPRLRRVETPIVTYLLFVIRKTRSELQWEFPLSSLSMAVLAEAVTRLPSHLRVCYCLRYVKASPSTPQQQHNLGIALLSFFQVLKMTEPRVMQSPDNASLAEFKI